MKKLMSILLVLSLVILLMGCNSNQSLLDASDVTDGDLEERTLYLFDIYVLPVFWWTGAGTFALDIDLDAEPLSDTPEYTKFYPVGRFNNIKEIKRATEQVVTKEYAEKYLYSYFEENSYFLERDGKLYINTEIGSGGFAYAPITATAISKTEDKATLSVIFQGTADSEKETYEIELQRENGIWKLNSTPYLTE